MALTQISSQRVFGGYYQRWAFQSNALNSQTIIGVYLPPDVTPERPMPVLYWLSGLTCTDENMMQKAGIQRLANHYGWVIVAPDTSPRGEGIADSSDRYDLGQGAGFYVNATQEPWSAHYRMYDYISEELPAFVESHFPVTKERAISGHSMGGLGALVIGLRNTERYSSISAFSPICNPMQCQWGKDAFSCYLGDDRQQWEQYDPVDILKTVNTCHPILIDQGLSDEFYPHQLHTQHLESIVQPKSLPIDIRYHETYDHSYYFIATFLEDHLEFHTKHLRY